jgi:hypothetical protein
VEVGRGRLSFLRTDQRSLATRSNQERVVAFAAKHIVFSISPLGRGGLANDCAAVLAEGEGVLGEPLRHRDFFRAIQPNCPNRFVRKSNWTSNQLTLPDRTFLIRAS